MGDDIDADDPREDTFAAHERLVDHGSELARVLMTYQAGIDEIMTKLTILRREYENAYDYNPIEHLAARLKSPTSILAKARRRHVEPTIEGVRGAITDIAGVRVITSFESDVYRVRDVLCQQEDLTVLLVKDYIAEPKPNGYRSLHVIVEVPVFFTDRIARVPVEVQFRTIAMDFWAALEHKIYYKFDRTVPEALLDSLYSTALTSAKLDADMEALHRQIRGAEPQLLDGVHPPTDGGSVPF
ncbi:GTP pyrophosphokinase [Raineyella fluvialis]|uniref:GTP pyrophosphokinase family protein n=1 Tax=Raineyella fluvialis TaxID=2662261 RepID=A0A5Q2F8B4_9ACTN|nr:GTP pyrophosphokinase family protein [Raineyella fluvialis]QGF23132.1 GTP pyrophosphokinase family protein [Raineyella fluvialis]